MTAFDSEVAALQYTVPSPGVGSRPATTAPVGHVRRPRAADGDEGVTTAADFEANVAMRLVDGGSLPTREKEEEATAQRPTPAGLEEILPELLKMTDIERADLIDELTRKAFVLMEAGEVKAATEQLERVARVGAAFQHLVSSDDKKDSRMSDEEYLGVRSQAEVLTQMQRELHQDDFVHIFGGKARWANFIGAW